jgi:hypothetical protein
MSIHIIKLYNTISFKIYCFTIFHWENKYIYCNFYGLLHYMLKQLNVQVQHVGIDVSSELRNVVQYQQHVEDRSNRCLSATCWTRCPSASRTSCTGRTHYFILWSTWISLMFVTRARLKRRTEFSPLLEDVASR